MKLKTRSFAASAALLVLAFTPVADTLSFAPAANDKAAKKLTVEGEFSLTDVSMTLNGEPVPGGGLDELTSKTFLMNLAVGVTDTYVSTKDGKPVDLVRAYDDVEAEYDFGEGSTAIEDAAGLEGKSVRFTWNQKTESYDVKYHESEGDSSELEGLIEDMDVRLLLPDGPVSAGDTWEVDAKRLQPLFMPGGFAVPGADKSASGGEEIQKNLESQFETFLETFKVACTYKGAREEGGAKVGEIAFTFEGKASLELGSLMETAMAQLGGGQVPEMSIDGSCGMTIDGEGSCLWNLETKRLSTFAMHADLGLDLSMELSGKQGDQPLEAAMSATAEGKIDWRLAPVP